MIYAITTITRPQHVRYATGVKALLAASAIHYDDTAYASLQPPLLITAGRHTRLHTTCQPRHTLLLLLRYDEITLRLPWVSEDITMPPLATIVSCRHCRHAYEPFTINNTLPRATQEDVIALRLPAIGPH